MSNRVIDISDWVEEVTRPVNAETDPWRLHAPVCYASCSLGSGLLPLTVQEQIVDDAYGVGADLAECPPVNHLMARLCLGGVRRLLNEPDGAVAMACPGCLSCSIILAGSEADELAVWLEGRLGWEVVTQRLMVTPEDYLVQTVGPVTLRWSGTALLDPVLGASAPEDPTAWRSAWRRLARRCPAVALAVLQRAVEHRDAGRPEYGACAPWSALWRRDVALLMVNPSREVRIGAAAILPQLGLPG